MDGGELRWRDAAATAVRTYFVVVASPVSDHVAGLSDRREPMLVEAFVAELVRDQDRIQVVGSAAVDP